MAILKTAVIISGGKPGTIHTMDTIEHDGKIWLVPYWFDTQDKQWTMPVRIVRIDSLRHQRSVGKPHHFVLNDSIPKAVLDGQVLTQEGRTYEVVERPPIRLPRHLH